MITAVAPLDLASLRGLVQSAEPQYTTVYLASSAGHAADHDEAEARWHRICLKLSSQGADPQTVDAIGRYLAMLPSEPGELAIVATGSHIVLTQPLPGGVPHDQAQFGRPPWIAPILAWMQRNPAYVAVWVDIDGIHVQSTPAASLEPGGVLGPFPSPAAATEAVEQESCRIGAKLILVGAFSARLIDRLRAARPTATIRRLNSADAAPAAVRAALDDYAYTGMANIRMMVDSFAATHSAAVQGVHATVAALSARRARVLLIVDDPADRRPAWFGPEQLCSVLPDLAQPGRTGMEGRLVDVAVRAALLTEVGIRVLGKSEARGLRGGMGAICA